VSEASALYDAKYREGYRQQLCGYEKARFEALKHFCRAHLSGAKVRRLLDYGAGSGLYLPLWREAFPEAEIFCADISAVALKELQGKFPDLKERCFLIEDDRVALPGESFDLLLSVEVMEHVIDVPSYLKQIHRLCRSGGFFLWTTPCGNAFSLEHLYSLLTGGIQEVEGGLRRWMWEEPSHLRRFKTAEVAALLRRAGFEDPLFRYRAHLFSFLCTRLFPSRLWSLKERLMRVDYDLFRRFPNAASMIGLARKS
jgi:SAM-dependent methyltransferase